MAKNLKRYYGQGDLHFITFSCHRRMPLLGTAHARNLFVRTLGEIRGRYEFTLVGYVVMPEHVHLLISEPKTGSPSTVIHGLKLRVSKRMRRRSMGGARSLALCDDTVDRFWQPRFYDFNVWSAKKRREKLEYMHRNPVTRKLVRDPRDWVWSSYASYSAAGTPLIGIDFVE